MTFLTIFDRVANIATNKSIKLTKGDNLRKIVLQNALVKELNRYMYQENYSNKQIENDIENNIDELLKDNSVSYNEILDISHEDLTEPTQQYFSDNIPALIIYELTNDFIRDFNANI